MELNATIVNTKAENMKGKLLKRASECLSFNVLSSAENFSFLAFKVL